MTVGQNVAEGVDKEEVEYLNRKNRREGTLWEITSYMGMKS